MRLYPIITLNDPFLIELVTDLEREFKAKPLFEDLADYAPFMLAMGREEFIDNHIQLLKKSLDNNGLFSKKKNYYTLHENYEIVFGLLEIYRIKGQKSHLDLAISVTNSCIKKFIVNGKIIRGEYLGIPSLYIAYYDYVFVELLVDIFQITGKEHYLSTANKLVQNFIKQNNAKDILFSSYSYLYFESLFRLIHKPTGFFLGKDSSLIFGMIHLANAQNNLQLMKRVRLYLISINSLMNKDGVLYRYIKLDTFRVEYPTLSAVFIYLNMLSFYNSISYDEELISISMKIADRYLVVQGKTGLFPHFIIGKESWIDTNTDFSISLFELSELTGEEKYRQAAIRCYEGIKRYNLEFSSVDINTGEKRRPVAFSSVRTRSKFKALFLKLVYLVESKQSIFGNHGIYSLLRDR